MAMVLTIRRVAAPRSAVARAAALLSIVAAFAAAAAEDDGPSVVPYRPSVSTPNAAATRLGAHEGAASRTQLLAAASLSRSIDEHWNVVGEVAGTGQHGADATRQLLVAASYNVSKRLVLDAGAARTLHAGAPSWSAFTGMTWLAARLF